MCVIFSVSDKHGLTSNAIWLSTSWLLIFRLEVANKKPLFTKPASAWIYLQFTIVSTSKDMDVIWALDATYYNCLSTNICTYLFMHLCERKKSFIKIATLDLYVKFHKHRFLADLAFWRVVYWVGGSGT